MLALNLPTWKSTDSPGGAAGKLANLMAGLRSIRTQYAGRDPMLAMVLAVSCGGMIRPLCSSRVRKPRNVVSTVTVSTRYPLAAARSTISRVCAMLRITYSWYQISSWPAAWAAAATSSIEVVPIVDSV